MVDDPHLVHGRTEPGRVRRVRGTRNSLPSLVVPAHALGGNTCSVTCLVLAHLSTAQEGKTGS